MIKQKCLNGSFWTTGLLPITKITKNLYSNLQKWVLITILNVGVKISERAFLKITIRPLGLELVWHHVQDMSKHVNISFKSFSKIIFFKKSTFQVINIVSWRVSRWLPFEKQLASWLEHCCNYSRFCEWSERLQFQLCYVISSKELVVHWPTSFS